MNASPLPSSWRRPSTRRFVVERLISARGGLSVLAVVDDTGERLSMVRASRGPDRRARITRIAEALDAISSPHVPTVCAADLEGDEPYIVLDFAAVLTLGDVLDALPARSVPYAAGSALTLAICEALAAAHQLRPEPVLIGALHRDNVIVTRSGQVALIGFGEDRADFAAEAVMAPHVAAGGECSPAADVYAGLLFVRSLVRYVAELPSLLVALLDGRAGREAGLFRRSLAMSLLGRGVDARWALRWLRRFWSVLGHTPDAAALAATIARVAGSAGRARLVIAEGGAWLQLEGSEVVDLSRRRAPRAVLWALAVARFERAGPLAAAELVDAGWPGEVLVGDSGPDRLYVAISMLRGVGVPIERLGEGYVIGEGVLVVPATGG